MSARDAAPLRLIVADDSELFRSELTAALTGQGMLVTEARDGQEALERCERERPDLVILDLNMPVMDGLQAIEQIMDRCATPILVVSGVARDDNLAIAALGAGALEVTTKPSALPIPGREVTRLAERIRMLASVPVFRRKPSRRPPPPAPRPERAAAIRLVVLAASTGGPSALAKVLTRLPEDFDVPLLIVQHLEPPFGASLVSWLDSTTSITVRLGSDGDLPEPRTALVVPPGFDGHLNRRGRLHLDEAEHQAERNSPSADKLLLSVARHVGAAGCGVILTGMGSDGAAGLLALRNAGGATFAQDGDSCVVDGMPRRARECGAVQHVVELSSLGAVIGRLPREGRAR